MTVKVGDLRMKPQRVSAENCVYDSVDLVTKVLTCSSLLLNHVVPV